jgi:hypothetical protein
MNGTALTTAQRWESLTRYSDTFTCYSAAVAGWSAALDEDWARIVNPGLWLTITEAPEGLLGFAYWPADLRSRLGWVRSGADDPQLAVEGVLAEVERHGRVVVAGDGFNLPWHVAHGRQHVPHWYVLAGTPAELLMIDPFACRNELGVQTAAREPVRRDRLSGLLPALPDEDPVYRLREVLALGDDTGPRDGRRYQWFNHAPVDNWVRPEGAHGPDAIRRLATHFRERGQDLAAYAQADDIWSIGRHRAFLCHYAQAVAERTGDATIAHWVHEHAAPLARRWGHIAPLMLQASLTLQAGRDASGSVAQVLEELADREHGAAQALPTELDVGRI